MGKYYAELSQKMFFGLFSNNTIINKSKWKIHFFVRWTWHILFCIKFLTCLFNLNFIFIFVFSHCLSQMPFSEKRSRNFTWPSNSTSFSSSSEERKGSEHPSKVPFSLDKYHSLPFDGHEIICSSSTGNLALTGGEKPFKLNG